MNVGNFQRYLVELVGTYMIVLFSAGAIVVGTKLGTMPIPVVAGVSAGATLAFVIMSFAHISGAHVNPAISLAFVYLKRLPPRLLPGYLIAQFVGSGLGGVSLLLIGDEGQLGANLPNLALGISPVAAVGVEILLSFLMMTVILNVTHENNVLDRIGAIPIGGIVCVEVMLFGPIAGAALNPARAFGPCLALQDWSFYWIYLVGPIVGVQGAAILHKCLPRLR